MGIVSSHDERGLQYDVLMTILNDDFDIHKNPVHRELFDAAMEESPMRSRRQIQNKITELYNTSAEREHAIALDVLRWVMDERVDWYVDDYIDDDEEDDFGVHYIENSSDTE